MISASSEWPADRVVAATTETFARTVAPRFRAERLRGGMTMAYMAGQLVLSAIVAALTGAVIWAVLVMRKPRPPLEDDDEW